MQSHIQNIATKAPSALKPHLLLIDDDRDLCQLVSQYLDAEGFTSTAVHTGTEGERSALAGGFALIV